MSFNNKVIIMDTSLDNVKEIFKDDDLSIVNLEGTLTDSNNGNTEKKFAFKGHPSYVNILKEGNIRGRKYSQ